MFFEWKWSCWEEYEQCPRPCRLLEHNWEESKEKLEQKKGIKCSPRQNVHVRRNQDKKNIIHNRMYQCNATARNYLTNIF